jgi:hypothetical protein
MDTRKPITDPQPEQPADQNAAGEKLLNPSHLFDRAFKRALRLSSPAVIRCINGAFGTSHPLDAEAEYLSTEHITGSLRQSICDMLVRLNHDDALKYLTESQIGDDGDMSFRMWNYSYLEGMRTRTTKGHLTEIKLVPAIVIYLEPGLSTPDTLSVKITGMDGDAHTFMYPALKLLDYTVEELEERALSILLPFYLLKLRKRVQSAKTAEKRQELTGEMKDLVEKLTAALERGEQNGKLDKSDTQTLIALMGKLYDNLYKGYPEFEEVHEMVDDMLLTAVDEAEVRGKTEGIALGEARGIAQVLDLLKSGKPPEEILQFYGGAASY